MTYVLHPVDAPAVVPPNHDERLRALVVTMRDDVVVSAVVADVCRSAFCPTCHPAFYEPTPTHPGTT